MNNPYKRIGGGSLDQALFKKREQQPPTTQSVSTLNEPTPSTLPLSNKQSVSPKKIDGLKSTATSKRAFIKRTFDLYEDQLAYLRTLSLQAKLSGKEEGMNAMVREAIDEWIKRRKANKQA